MACLVKKIFSKKFRGFPIYEAYQFSRRSILKNTSHFFSSECPKTNLKSSLCVLGIETSGHDTGAAVVNEHGTILGEGYYPQSGTLVFGDRLSSEAAKHHRIHIDKAVTEALRKSNISPENLSAVAVTVKPGNISTLKVGCDYGKKFALQHKLPFIPIHHMEAHALTVRMENEVKFPFVVLLVSGGHNILGIAHSINKWSILGEDKKKLALGALLDKIAYRLSLRKLPDLSDVIGGKAFEKVAAEGNFLRYPLPPPTTERLDPSFNFSNLQSFVNEFIRKCEFNTDIEEGNVLDNVISGGVASNQFLRTYFKVLCDKQGYRLLIPEPKLCTDNGVMVAWNGIEKWKAGLDILRTEEKISAVSVEPEYPLGPNLSKECKSTKIPKLVHCTMEYRYLKTYK
ncbi:putative tRNA N6-adenosine threonylcarbamoyltransferase, mitochondrial [Armadillidium vulgare]|nr:putative tRNA N6-adenosine threonylcarbamoyltransferase, mitochondrial [Armadillidium vulgare]